MGTQIRHSSPTFARSSWLIRGSFGASSTSIGCPLSIAKRAIEPAIGRRASNALTAMPVTARVCSIVPSIRLTIAPSRAGDRLRALRDQLDDALELFAGGRDVAPGLDDQ